MASDTEFEDEIAAGVPEDWADDDDDDDSMVGVLKHAISENTKADAVRAKEETSRTTAMAEAATQA